VNAVPSRFNPRVLRCDSTTELRAALAAVGADPRGVDIMVPKGRFYLIKVEGLKYAAASILKQELLSKGGDAAVSGEIYYGGEHASDALLLATERALRRVINTLRHPAAAQPADVGRRIGRSPARRRPPPTRRRCASATTISSGAHAPT